MAWPEARARTSTSSSRELEAQALGGLDLVVEQLDRALEAVSTRTSSWPAMVIADDDRIDGRYLEVHQGILSLLAPPGAGGQRPAHRRRPAARDQHVERMGDQCVNIAKLVPLSGHEPPTDKDILDAIERMGQLRALAGRAGQAGVRASATSTSPRTSSARTTRSTGSTARSSGCAVEIGDDPDMREWAMHMMLVARCLERIGDNTVDIGEQTAFVVTGLFREFTDASTPPETAPAG